MLHAEFLIGCFREMVGNWPVVSCYFALWLQLYSCIVNRSTTVYWYIVSALLVCVHSHLLPPQLCFVSARHCGIPPIHNASARSSSWHTGGD